MTVSTAERRFNVGEFLPRAAAAAPDQKALIYKEGGRWTSVSFAELERKVDGYARALRSHGVERGMRVLIMLRGAEFVALTFAAFKIGAVPALIDPGMGLQGVLACIRHLKPEVLIAIKPVFVIRAFFPRSFRSVRHAFSVGGSFLGAKSLRPQDGRPTDLADTLERDTAAILFTSGSTGPAKGVVYRHGIFAAQVKALQGMFEFSPGDLDMPGFPLFALFSTALGQTCVLPELNPSRPATVDPKKIVAAVNQFKVASLQGSPAIWTRVGRYCHGHGIKLPSVKRVLTFGAPISVGLLRTWRDVLPQGAQVHTPYGATEALPIASIGSDEVLSETAEAAARGAGTCVGRLAPEIDVRIIRIDDAPIEAWADDLVQARGEVGEIAVSGPVVTWEYDGLPQATRAAKIREGERVWHRMGDLGYFDAVGRLWFCGRKNHRIEGPQTTWYSVNGEGMVDVHPDVARSALVGVGRQPVLVVEPKSRPSRTERDRLRREVLALLHADPSYRSVQHVLFHPAFPVDPRHNAKIHREELADWATRKI